jgi:hypothetical protein
LLVKHGYPPDAKPDAAQLVLTQRETFAEEWSPLRRADPATRYSRRGAVTES